MTPSMHAYIKQIHTNPLPRCCRMGPPEEDLVLSSMLWCTRMNRYVEEKGEPLAPPHAARPGTYQMFWTCADGLCSAMHTFGGMRIVRKIRAAGHLREVHKLGLFIKTTICSQMYWNAPSYLGELLYHSNGQSNAYKSLFLERSCTYGGKKRGRITIS